MLFAASVPFRGKDKKPRKQKPIIANCFEPKVFSFQLLLYVLGLDIKIHLRLNPRNTGGIDLQYIASRKSHISPVSTHPSTPCPGLPNGEGRKAVLLNLVTKSSIPSSQAI